MMKNYTFTQATLSEVPEIEQFSKENMSPEYHFCIGAPPFPSAEAMTAYIEAGHPFVLARRDGELIAYGIASRRSGEWLWGMGHKNVERGLEAEVYAHISAHAWKIFGEAVLAQIPEVGEESLASELNSATERALEIYESLE